MIVTILSEAGHKEALLGLSLSYNHTGDLSAVARKLAPRDGGHNKFLESICVWLEITAPRYWWQQFDSYRVGVTKSSESTMHTLTGAPLVMADFQRPIAAQTLTRLNELIAVKDLAQLKVELPEGFLQCRIVATNYKTLAHIIAQRRTHKLAEWAHFCAEVYKQCQHPEYLDHLFTGVKNA